MEIEGMDRDGLDDNWACDRFNGLQQAPDAVSETDNYLDAYKHDANMDPAISDIPFESDLSFWNDKRVRLS